ncbi:hypothetical protein CB1_001179008 [Camelus ferus]|nr:hypothetical protein CB1_001179008 [Camelus ferus]
MHGPTTQLTATCVSDAVKTVAARSIWEGHVCAFVPVLVETQVLGGPYTRVLDGFISIFVEGSGILLSPWWTGSRGCPLPPQRQLQEGEESKCELLLA